MRKRIDSNQLLLDFTKPIDKETKIWTVDAIRELLIKSEKMRRKAFFKIWERTRRFKIDEQGFNRFDYNQAEIYWKEYQIYQDFTPNALAWLERIIPKYAPQLYRAKHT